MKKRVRFLTAALLFFGVASLLSSKQGQKEYKRFGFEIALRNTGAENDTEDDLVLYQDFVLGLMRKASKEYPVPYVREKLSALFLQFDEQKFVIKTIRKSPEGAHAILRLTADGRPKIILFLQTNAKVVNTIIQQLGSTEGSVLDPVLTDWYVTIFLHEYSHYERDHRHDSTVTDDMHLRQESEAWEDTVKEIVKPALRAGRFRHTPNQEIAYALLCYQASNNDVRQPPWQAFIKFIAAKGPTSEVARLCPQAQIKIY